MRAVFALVCGCGVLASSKMDHAWQFLKTKKRKKERKKERILRLVWCSVSDCGHMAHYRSPCLTWIHGCVPRRGRRPRFDGDQLMESQWHHGGRWHATIPKEWAPGRTGRPSRHGSGTSQAKPSRAKLLNSCRLTRHEAFGASHQAKTPTGSVFALFGLAWSYCKACQSIIRPSTWS
jgi:hypothetical protein